jgi:hypothetical protein
VLAYPNFDLPFILTTDASKLAVAAVLSQVQDGAERPSAYVSRQLNQAEVFYGLEGRNASPSMGHKEFPLLPV